MTLLSELRTAMAAHADPDRARAMQAYMKSTMPFHGLTLPETRSISRLVFARLDRSMSCERWRGQVLAVWRGARYREERYAALALVRDARYAACRTPAAMPMLEEMVVTGAWWDTADDVAHIVGEVLRAYPARVRPLMRAWSTDADLWKRRVSIICQNGFKRETDLDLLFANIEANFSDRDFFIRKAIGWALRAYAWTDPVEVARYVRDHESSLSPLSRREALKNVPAALR